MRQVEDFDTRYRYPSFVSALTALVGYFSTICVDTIAEKKDETMLRNSALWKNSSFVIEHTEALRGPDTFLVKELRGTVLGVIFEYASEDSPELSEYEVMPCPDNWTLEQWKEAE